MNYLAHFVLSENIEPLIVGNFMGDFVKGNQWQKFPQAIINGIKMHRAIDSYTDSHQAFKQSKYRFQNKYKKYAGVVTDILYDYCLCKNWNDYCHVSLSEFASNIYTILEKNKNLFPDKAKITCEKMIKKNWLEAYKQLSTIKLALTRMPKYTSLPDYSDFAIDVIKNNSQAFDAEFNVFFADIKKHVTVFIQ